MSKALLAAYLISVALLGGCLPQERATADLSAIYSTAAQQIGDERTPVVVIPGILGSKLQAEDGTKVWGSFTYGSADVDTPEGARQMALPMRLNTPLSQIHDDVIPDDVLDVVEIDFGLIRGLEIGAYIDIMQTLAAGKYRDQSLGDSGAVDYGGLHYTCFQLPYDWRRDVSEQAALLDQVIRNAQDANRMAKGQDRNAEIKVDVVAHSMGGLLLRYYLRYGAEPLPDDGSLPDLTWAGAKNVRQAILIGTPNAGSAKTLDQLVNGLNLAPFFPNYRPCILGTMPAIYQLLPRERHAAIVHEETGEPVDIFDVNVWEELEWGLLSPKEDTKLKHLLPDVETAEERYAIAHDHLTKSLAKAEQFHRALDIPASPPAGTTISLFAGDSESTATVIAVDSHGNIREIESGPGDGTVARYSAIQDERTGSDWKPFMQSPIDWNRVQFIFADHIGLTRDPAFIDNLLFMLLETDNRGVEQ